MSLRTVLSTLSYSLTYVFIIYPSTSSTVLETFPCDDFDDGSRRLRADYSIDCNADNRASWLAYNLLMTFVYPVGCVVLYTVVLWAHHKQLNPAAYSDGPEPPMDEQVAARDNDESLEHLAFLVQSYKPRYWWMEIFNAGYKVAITGVIVFFVPGTATQIVIALLVSLIALAVQGETHAYVEDGDNRLATMSSWAITLSLLAALFEFVDTSEENQTSRQAFDAALVVTTSEC